MCDLSYGAVADVLCDAPLDMKGISDSPSLNNALGHLADKLSFALMEAHAYGSEESPDEGAAQILDTGREILFEEVDGALRFGVNMQSGAIEFEILPSGAADDDRCITIAPELSGKRDLQLHDVRAVMLDLTNRCGSMDQSVNTLALSIGRWYSEISLGVWVSTTDAPDEYLSIPELKTQFMQ